VGVPSRPNPQTVPSRQADPLAQSATEPPWQVIVWDDPVNLMTHVVRVLQKVFGYNRALATKLMLEVHHQGRSLVATEPREQAELHVTQLHEHGLQATLERAEA
jgi:ATP-dependent Clp protease adaptor protein ClpS